MNRDNLHPTRAVSQVADNRRAWLHVAVTARLQGAGVTEGVAAIVESDEAVPFGGVKPLYFSLRRGLRNGLFVAICHCEPTLFAPCRLDTPSRPASRPRAGNCDMMTIETCSPQRGCGQKCQPFACCAAAKCLTSAPNTPIHPRPLRPHQAPSGSDDPRCHRRT